MTDFLAPRKIVVHYSASDVGDVEMFREWHKARGWSDVGYHYVIDNDPDGQIQYGRSVLHMGAHTRGHNSYSIGICLVGDGEPAVTPRQIVALVNLCCALCVTYRLDPMSDIVGHRDLLPTLCPGDDIYNRLPTIRAGVLHRMKADYFA